jgi:hypothetical protein
MSRIEIESVHGSDGRFANIDPGIDPGVDPGEYPGTGVVK